MEKENDAVVSAISKSRLRYPTTKLNSRGRSASTVSMSVGALHLSDKDKPPRRLSIPAKSSGTRKSKNDDGKIETPAASSVSSLASRKKFNALSSASYWLKQIKLSESAAKHSISIGFFKLAFEAGCENLPRMRDELKSYARRHNLGDHGLLAKELFDSYNITETPEQVQVSQTRSSDDEVCSTSSTVGTRRLKPRSLNTEAARVSSVTVSAKKETSQKNNPTSRTRSSVNKIKPAETMPVSETRVRKQHKKLHKPSNKEKEPGNNSACDKGLESPSTATDIVEEDKENMDDTEVDETENV